MVILVALVVLLIFLLLSIPVAATLAALGLSLGSIYSSFPLYRALGEISWTAGTDFLHDQTAGWQSRSCG